MAAAATSIDLTDIPASDPADLARLMQILIRNGHGLVLLDGVKQSARDAAEAEFWGSDDIDGRAKAVAIVRFRALVEAFSAERLQAHFLDHGLALLPRLFRVAATMRLNARRGFNLHSLFWRLTAKSCARTATNAGAHPVQPQLSTTIHMATVPAAQGDAAQLIAMHSRRGERSGRAALFVRPSAPDAAAVF